MTEAPVNAHHHSGLSYLTPADVHYGRAATVLAVRHRTRLAAYAAHPERFRPGATTARNAPNSRLDQSAAETDPRGCPRSDDRHPGRPAAWGDLPVTTHQCRSLDHARRQHGVATVNAESGCLNVVDTARSSAPPRPSPRIAISNYYPLSQVTDAFNHGLLRPF